MLRYIVNPQNMISVPTCALVDTEIPQVAHTAVSITCYVTMSQVSSDSEFEARSQQNFARISLLTQ